MLEILLFSQLFVGVRKGLLKYLEGLLATGVNENRHMINIKQDGQHAFHRLELR